MSLFTVVTILGLVVATIGPWPDSEASRNDCRDSAIEGQQRGESEEALREAAKAMGQPIQVGDIKVSCLSLEKAPPLNSRL